MFVLLTLGREGGGMSVVHRGGWVCVVWGGGGGRNSEDDIWLRQRVWGPHGG